MTSFSSAIPFLIPFPTIFLMLGSSLWCVELLHKDHVGEIEETLASIQYTDIRQYNAGTQLSK